MKKRTRLFFLTTAFCLLSALSLGVLHHSKLDAQADQATHQLLTNSDQVVKTGGMLILQQFGQAIRSILTQ